MKGFSMMSMLGGGTGSGLTDLLLENISDFDPKCIKMGVHILPASTCSQVETVSAMLGLNYLME